MCVVFLEQFCDKLLFVAENIRCFLVKNMELISFVLQIERNSMRSMHQKMDGMKHCGICPLPITVTFVISKDTEIALFLWRCVPKMTHSSLLQWMIQFDFGT